MVGPAGPETLVISAARMLDVENGRVTGPVRVAVRDGLIESVNPERLPAEHQTAIVTAFGAPV
jgi:imidazolonepropionase-like amidohydrolase